MKSILLALALFATLPALAEECRFSRQLAESNAVEAVSCPTKMCSHIIVCDGTPSLVACPARDGQCDGYDAAACKSASARIAQEAQFEPSTTPETPDRPARREGVGGR